MEFFFQRPIFFLFRQQKKRKRKRKRKRKMHSSLVWRGVRRGVVSCSLKRGQGEGLKRFPGLNKTIASSSSSSSPSSSSSSSLLSSSSSLLPSSCSPLADNFRWFSSSAPKMDEGQKTRKYGSGTFFFNSFFFFFFFFFFLSLCFSNRSCKIISKLSQKNTQLWRTSFS